MNYIVQHLLEEIDSKTQALLPLNGNLVLLGDLESQFLKSVRKKAERFGINCIGRIENPAGIVVDIETAKIDREFMEGFNRSPFNIDGPLLNGMTSVSQAAYMILDDQGLIRGKNVTIVGRGNAVTGLAEMLSMIDCGTSCRPCSRCGWNPAVKEERVRQMARIIKKTYLTYQGEATVNA